ncbi:ribonuclease H-like domain-containing protein [Tanacetum coccineum]
MANLLDENSRADKCVYSKFDESGKGVIICLYVDDMLIFGIDQVQVELTKEFLSSRFSMKDMREADVILVSTPMDTSEKLMPNNSQVVSQLEYSRVIGSLMYAMTYTRLDIVFVVGKLSRYTSNPGTQHWQAIQRVLKYLKKTMDYRLTYTGYPSVLKGYIDASWISNTKHNSSTSGWVFLLGGGVISWASKKQACITGSTIESEFVALAAAGKESECVATSAKAYSQMYNGKSKHLGVRHSMIRELITNGVVSIEFVRSQQNLVDHLMKGLARDLIIKSAEGMGLNLKDSSVSNTEGLHKGYDRFQSLLIFENDVKGSTASSSSMQNVAFVSENTSSTNDVSTAYSVSNPSGQNSQYEQTSSYSLLANQSSCPQLDHEDLEQLDEYDLEEMDLKWQVAMISMRMKKFYKKTGRKLQFDAKEPDGRRSGKKEDSKALVTIDGEGVDWTNHSEEDEDYALMACNNSESDTEVTSCSNKCKESYANLKKLYDAQREQLSDASIEIKAYSQGLKKVEAQLVAHQQGQLWYEQKIKFMKIDLDDKTDVLTYHKKLLAEAQKEKEDLKAKVEKWHNSSKNLSKLLNTQMSANDKFGLGYGDHRYDGILSYENEVLQSVFMNKESELEKQPLYDRFVTAGGMHAVPPPMTGNYMPSGPDIEVDYSQFTYGPKQTQPSESESQSSEFDTCESNISTEPSELVSEPVVNESNVECQPKVWSDAPIIEEYESDSEDEYVSIPTKEQETPSFANQQVKTPRETVKNQFTHSQKPKVDKKELGYGFTLVLLVEKGKLLLSPQQVVIGDHKDTTGTISPNYPHIDLKNKGIVNSGCSRHMTGNKAYLAEFQDFNGGSVACRSEVPVEPQTDPSPRPSPSTTIPDSIPKSSGGNLGGHSSNDKSLSWTEGEMTLQSVYDLCLSLCAQVSDQAKEIQNLKAHIKKLKKQAKPVVKHHRAWMKSVSLKQRLARKRSSKKQWMHRESVSKQGRKFVKGSTDRSKVSTDRQKDSTDEKNEGTDDQSKGTDEHTEEGRATQTTQPPHTSIIFGDDETIAKVLLNMSQAKAVSREKEKAEKKFKQLASDEEMARKVQEWKGEEERNKLAEEKATNEALIRNYDDIKARIEADRLLAEKLQEEEREQFTIEERAKFLHDIIAAQRKFLAQQRSEAIRNRPPTKNQLRNQMMTYLKHVGNFKHSDFITKKFEEIQALYEKIKRSDEDFISIGSAEDERLIKKMNEKAIDSSKNENGHRVFDELRLCLTIAPDEDKEVDYEILDKKYPVIEWRAEYLGTKPQVDKAKHLEEINQNVVIWESNGQKEVGTYFNELRRGLVIRYGLVEEKNASYRAVNLKDSDGEEEEDLWCWFQNTTTKMVISSPCLTGIRIG